MKRTGSLEQRLQDLKDSIWTLSRGEEHVVVEESADAGRAYVQMKVPSTCHVIQWILSPGHFQFLKDEKRADGALLVVPANGRVEAHIIECKHSISDSKWGEALWQFRSTALRLASLAGALGLTIDRWVFYTVFRHDRLSDDEQVNPAELKERLGPGDEASGQAPFGSAWRRQREWMREAITLAGWEGELPHVKIQKDDEGRAWDFLRVDLTG